MKNRLIVLVIYIIIIDLCNNCYSMPIDKTIIDSTVLISDESGKISGTGFLVNNDIKTRVYLVTNKHVVSHINTCYKYREKIFLGFKTHQREWLNIPVKICDSSGTVLSGVYPHPNNMVDIIVLNISDILNAYFNKNIKMIWLDYSLLATTNVIKNESINIGDDIFIIGYPKGYRNIYSQTPFVRDGTIATNTEELLSLEIKDEFNREMKNINAFIIDANIFPGMSGSPVILKPRFIIEKNKFINIERGMVGNYILGILSHVWLYKKTIDKVNIEETIKYYKIERFTNDEIALGIVFNAQLIRECIEYLERNNN